MRRKTKLCEGACLGEDECNEAVIRIESDYESPKAPEAN